MINAKDNNSPYKLLFEIAKYIGAGTYTDGNKQQHKRNVPFTGLSISEAIDRILQLVQENKLHVILVIDEIDAFVDKNGDEILYTFTRANQRLKGGFVTLIGISNRDDFKEKLDPRVRSSLSEEEIVFHGYTIEQLGKILQQRSELAFNTGAITAGAINLCAVIAGKDHGDARKAIDLLRVAAELAERDGAGSVQENHIRQAQEQIERDITYDILKNSTMHSKLVLLAVMRSGSGFTGEVYTKYSTLCQEIEQEPLTQRRLTQIIGELKQQGLVDSGVISQGRYGRSQRIKLTVPPAKLQKALQDDPTFTDILS
jgi:cell division control protein 6